MKRFGVGFVIIEGETETFFGLEIELRVFVAFLSWIFAKKVWAALRRLVGLGVGFVCSFFGHLFPTSCLQCIRRVDVLGHYRIA